MTDKNNPKPRRERRVRKPRVPRVSKAAVELLNQSAYGADEPEAVDFTQHAPSVMIRALNWYNACRTVDDARRWTAEFLDAAGVRDGGRDFRKLPDTSVSLTAGWLCRLAARGAVLGESDRSFMTRKISECLVGGPVDSTPPKSVQTARERARDRQSEILGEIEGMLDDSDGVEPIDLYAWLSENDVPPAYCAAIVAKLNPRFEELRQVYTSGDPQLREGYSHMTKAEVRLQASIISVMMGDAARYADDKKPVRKERKPKAVTPEKRVQHLRYKAEDAALGVKSVDPKTILGAQELWTFNAKYRLLTVYRAADRAGLDVHRSSVTSVDDERSRTLRIKPKFVKGALDAVQFATAVGRETMIEGDETGVLQSRINENTLLVKVVR